MNFCPVQLQDPSKIKVEESMKVVLVDDSLLVRERIASIISEIPGAEVVGKAGDSIEAIEIVRKTKPDMVILDIKIPGENGLQVLRKFKNEFVNMKIIMLTNYSDSQYKAECLMHGADYFLSKSDEFDRLPEVFSKLARRHKNKFNN
jgi:DNA-binding NarL/FixJ family response regulator